MSFLQELRRRKVFRVGAAYAIVAWLLIQIAVAVFPMLQLPEWTPRFVTVLLIIGFPIALLLAWAFELTPDGIRTSRQVAATGHQAGASGRGLDYALLAGLLLVAGSTLFTQLRTESAQAPLAAVGSRPSVAVLPFEDLSATRDQEYLGDGIAGELINELTRLGGMDVASRTSAFAFKGSAQSVREIGRELGVGTVVEGTVRRNGDTFRVQAQLTNVADGYALWSQSYDMELGNSFRVQEGVARAISGALGVQFGIGGTNAFRGAGTRTVEVYDEYLRAFSTADVAERIRILEHVVDLDPDYASAWAELGLAKAAQLWEDLPSAAPGYQNDALTPIMKAVALDSENADAHSMLGSVLYASNRWSEGQAEHDRAIELRSGSDTLTQNGLLLFRAGRLTAALAQWDAASKADTLLLPVSNQYFSSLTMIGLSRFAEAASLADELRPGVRQLEVRLFRALNAGTREDVRAAISAINQPRIVVTNLYQPLLAVFDDREAVLSLLHEANESDAAWPSKWHDLARLAAYFGDPDFALELVDAEARYVPARNYLLWMPFMADVRKLPGFKQLMRDVGLVDYWREYGWPDLCRPVGESDFACS